MVRDDSNAAVSDKIIDVTILKIGHPALRRKAKRIPPPKINHAVRTFAAAMVKEMRRSSGVGLAANQVGKGVRLIVLEAGKSKRYPKAPKIPLQIYANPQILAYSDSLAREWEGCLSIPGYRGNTPRPREILFDATTLDGKAVRRVVKGFEARILQHEVDHLNGSFYVDRLPSMKEWI